MRKIHFISGLPRSGSTLLTAIFRQNPNFQARMSSPVSHIYEAVLRAMTPENKFSIFIDEDQKSRLLKGIFDSYYADIPPEKALFDTNRDWTGKISGISHLFPDSKIICCVRDVAWIIDSFERLVQKNPFDLSRLFNFDPTWSVYDRAYSLMSPKGAVGRPLNFLKEAYSGEESGRLLFIDYEKFTRSPQETLKKLYHSLGEPVFEHDLENLTYTEGEFDAHIGLKNMHTIDSPVAFRPRKTILPPDLFKVYEPLNFWRHSNQLI